MVNYSKNMGQTPYKKCGRDRGTESTNDRGLKGTSLEPGQARPQRASLRDDEVHKRQRQLCGDLFGLALILRKRIRVSFTRLLQRVHAAQIF
jgi:hypothetical protein